jgi:transposase
MILYAKFGEHQPLNRQSESYAREGIELDVSTLADWVGACTASLAPLIELIRRHVLAAERIHADDTTVPVLAKEKTVIGRLWAYVRDDRPFAGPDPPGALFFYSRNRRGEHPDRHLAGYSGILQADAYAGFGDLYDAKRKPAPITEAACWSHSRRKFFELADLRKAPLAIEAVRRIDAIFAIEREINGATAEQRLAFRNERVKPLLSELEVWMRAERARLSRHADLAKAIDYMLKRWPAFTRFLDDGRICLSNNAAERALRGIALGRRAWLFAGSDEGASCCSPHHVIGKPIRFCWRPSGSGRRDRRILACRRTSSRTRSSCRIIHGAPLQCCLAGRMPSAMRRRMVEVLTARTPAAWSIVTSPRSARSPSR